MIYYSSRTELFIKMIVNLICFINQLNKIKRNTYKFKELTVDTSVDVVVIRLIIR